MNTCHIDHPNFNLQLQLKVFESDIPYPSNTIMTVAVDSDGFCGKTEMEIDIKQFVEFSNELSTIYSTLNGTAIIQEPYGEEQFVKFNGDGSGHVTVNGKFTSNNRNGFAQSLFFENNIDQTCLQDFVKSLSGMCAQYR